MRHLEADESESERVERPLEVDRMSKHRVHTAMVSMRFGEDGGVAMKHESASRRRDGPWLAHLWTNDFISSALLWSLTGLRKGTHNTSHLLLTTTMYETRILFHRQGPQSLTWLGYAAKNLMATVSILVNYDVHRF